MENKTIPFGPGCPWYDMYEKWGPSNVKWCEERICAWVNEPANAWSNLGYIIAGILIIIYARKKMKSLGQVFGFFVICVGFTSMLYHASNNYFTQIFDFIGMYMYVYLLLVLNLFKLDWLPRKKVVPLFLTLVVISTLMIPVTRFFSIPYQLIVFLSAVAITVTEALHQIRSAKRREKWSYRYFWIALGTFVLALSCSISDVKRFYCDPTNHWLQGHALWHWIGAFAMGFSFMYYRQFLPIDAKPKDPQNTG